MTPPTSPLKVPKRGQRTFGNDGPARCTRSRTMAIDPRQIRDFSPSKNVHFSRNLILGPTEIDPRRRSLSPSRSALRRNDSAIDSPSFQLLMAQSAVAPGSGRAKKLANGKQRRLSNAKRAPREAPIETISEPTMDLDFDVDLATVVNGGHNDICNLLNKLKDQIKEFAADFSKITQPDALSSLFKLDNSQLVRYIGLLALGRKGGENGWKELLSDPECRSALVVGIISRALKEKVFDELYFGCDDKLHEELKKQQEDLVQKDGFYRSQQRAFTIVQNEKESITATTMNKAVAQVAMQLEKLLLPLWEQGGTRATWKSSNKRKALTDIVHSAASLSQTMRKDFNTIYYWPPTFKDEEFEPERMECFNVANMIRKSPYDTKKMKNNYVRAVLRPGHRHEDTALVRIVCFPGLVSYQQGGGHAAKQEAMAERNQARSNRFDDEQHYERAAPKKRTRDSAPEDQGFRTRILCKATVLLQWGNQRILTREAGTSAHRKAIESGDKKYHKDEEGVVELYDLFLVEMAKQESNRGLGISSSPQRSWWHNMLTRSPSAQPERT